MLGLIGGIASGLGSLVQGGLNYRAQQETNQANIDMNAANNAQNLAITQQLWNRDDTAIQRRTSDLRAAGLNPVLAAGQGAQSSSPIAMQSARSQAPSMSGMGDSISKGAAAYGALVQAKQLKEREQAITDKLNRENRILDRAQVKQEMEMSKIWEEQRLLQEQYFEKRHNNQWYIDNRLPTNATGPIKDFAEARAIIKEKLLKAEEKGVHVQGLLDLLGGY